MTKKIDKTHTVNNLPYLTPYRKKLRNNLTPAEARLWKFLRNRKLEGRKFRRQHSIGNFILDFYCPSEKLGIELDGKMHYRGKAVLRDRQRGLFLEQFGVRMLRFENKKVRDDLPWVIDVIKGNFGWENNEETED